MYDHDKLMHRATSYSMQYIISYDIKSQTTRFILDVSYKRASNSAKLNPPAVMIYHHDGIFFDYIIPQWREQP